MDFTQQTVVLVKPDGVKRGLVGEILSRFEKVGFKIVALKMVWVSEDFVGQHYKDEKDYVTSLGQRTLEDYNKYGLDPNESLGTMDPYQLGSMVRKFNMEALSNGPLVAILLEGVEVVSIVRKMVGATNTSQAIPGTIRGDYSADLPIVASMQKRPIRTIVHASGTVEEANFEKQLWFKAGEIQKYDL